MARFSITLERRAFAKDSRMRERLLSALEPSIRRAGLAVQRTIQQDTPVVTGNLRRSWTTSEVAKQGDRAYVQVGTSAVYANRVNQTSRRAKGFIERGVSEGRAEAEKTIRAGIEAAVGAALRGEG